MDALAGGGDGDSGLFNGEAYGEGTCIVSVIVGDGDGDRVVPCIDRDRAGAISYFNIAGVVSVLGVPV